MPRSSRRSASHGPFVSRTRPVRTSVPVTTTPARALTRRASGRAGASAGCAGGSRSRPGAGRPAPLAPAGRARERRELRLVARIVADPVLLDEHVRVDAEELRVRAQEALDERGSGQHAEVLVLESTKVFGTDLGLGLDVCDV